MEKGFLDNGVLVAGTTKRGRGYNDARDGKSSATPSFGSALSCYSIDKPSVEIYSHCVWVNN